MKATFADRGQRAGAPGAATGVADGTRAVLGRDIVAKGRPRDRAARGARAGRGDGPLGPDAAHVAARATAADRAGKPLPPTPGADAD